jgi:methyltransferase family protein
MTKQWQLVFPYFEYTESFEDNSTPWAGHKCFGYNLVRNLEPGLVVELGSWKGTSFYSFCQAVKDTKSKTKLIAVDTWQGDSHAGHFGDKVFNDFNAILTKYYNGVSASHLRKSFNEAVNDFEDQTIDILHIDGFHTYQAVSNDFNTWKSKMKANGVILFHDVSEQKEDFEVYKFWEEIKAKYKTCLEFSHSHGLGILFLDEEKYKFVAQNFERDKVKCLEYSYQLTKAELFNDKILVRELADIKSSKYWLVKERFKRLLGRG